MRFDFYDLKAESTDSALLDLLERIIASKKKTIIVLKDESETERVNDWLWQYDEESFIPHGSKKDGNEKMQTIYLADAEEFKNNKRISPNSASFIIYMSVLISDIPDKNLYERCFVIFGNRNRMELENARILWKAAKESGGEMHLWRNDGKWREASL